MRSVTILGSTGSIGQSTIDLILQKPNEFSVEALVAHKDVETLARQAKQLKAKFAVVGDPTYYDDLKEALSGTSIEVGAGEGAVLDAARRPTDWLMSAIVGIAGLKPTLVAAERGAIIALANKESIVSAGPLLLKTAHDNGATILPTDSEHNAIFQVLTEPHRPYVDKLILTASGGPFRCYTPEQFATITPEAALKHPNWVMGAKITIDCATLINKGLELIEASYLFSIPESKIDILVHPQSIIHSMVAYKDGSFLAQLGVSDMRIPISYTLAWPHRMETTSPVLNLAQIGQLTFEEPDYDRFPALSLARQALREGGNRPIILNAANEIAVHAFLAKQIPFTRICSLISDVLTKIPASTPQSLEDIYEVDETARRLTQEFLV